LQFVRRRVWDGQFSLDGFSVRAGPISGAGGPVILHGSGEWRQMIAGDVGARRYG